MKKSTYKTVSGITSSSVVTGENTRINVLTKERCNALASKFLTGGKISRAKFNENDICRLVSTIWDMNATSCDDASFNNEPISELVVPECFKGMVFSEISLTAVRGEVLLVEWRNDSEYEPLSVGQIKELTAAIYMTFRTDSKYTNVAEIITGKTSIADYTTQLMYDQERVSTMFDDTKFPIIATVQTFLPRLEGATLEAVMPDVINHIRNSVQ